MDGPELLLHVVGGKEVQNGGELQQQVVLESEDGGRSDNGGLGEDASGNEFSSSLKCLGQRRRCPNRIRGHTLVAKNSEVEFGLAL